MRRKDAARLPVSSIMATRQVQDVVMREIYSDNDVSVEPGPERRMIVDGEEFSVCEDGRGGTSYTWTSGPNDGYGFGSSPTRGFDEDAHVAAILTFLRQIDPKTGYIAED